MQDFAFKNIDKVGLDTLSVIEEAKNFNRWMYDVIRPYLKGNVLEIGSGTGNISEFAVLDGFEVSLSDIRENYRDILRNKFSSTTNVKNIVNLDIVDPNFDKSYKDYLGTFDSLFCLNVVEHVEDDKLALRNCSKLLKKNGHLIILVPAFQQLYNEFDKQLEHYRRYNRASLLQVFPSEINIVHSQYFNLIGILGWFFSGAILKKSSIPGGQMKIYNLLIRFLKYADNIVLHRIGLSVIAVGEKR